MRSSFSAAVSGLAAAVALVGALVAAEPAKAQRALTNTNSGNDPPPVRRDTNALVGCSVRNTAQLAAGVADACLGLLPQGESASAVSQIIGDYNLSAGVSYTLALAAGSPDQRSGTDGTSSGGLFSVTGLGTDRLGLRYQREERGSFVFAFSGLYSNSATHNLPSAWSGYYLYDDVITNIVDLGAGLFVDMPYRAFQTETFLVFDPALGTLVTKPRWAFTEGLVVNQVSVYRLDRSATNPVPEPSGIALALLALAAAGIARGRRGRRAS